MTDSKQLGEQVETLEAELAAARQDVEQLEERNRVLAAAIAEQKRDEIPQQALTEIVESLYLIHDGFLNALTAAYQGDVDDLVDFLCDQAEGVGQALAAARAEKNRRERQQQISDAEIDDVERLAGELLVQARRIG